MFTGAVAAQVFFSDNTLTRHLIFSSYRLLRSVLSVKDEFYHRHIVQYNLFSPVFDLFCEGGTFVGNNLISSAVLEVRHVKNADPHV